MAPTDRTVSPISPEYTTHGQRSRDFHATIVDGFDELFFSKGCLMTHSCPIANRAVVILSIVFLAKSSLAIDINIYLKNNGMNPAYDSDRSRLYNTFTVAAALWED